MDLYGGREIDLPMAPILILLGIFLLAGGIIHAMGHPLICECGYVKLWHGGIDDAEVSQHFIDTYSEVLHGIIIYYVIYYAMRLFAQDRPAGALGLLIVASFAAVWEILENTPFIVSYAKTTLVRVDVGDSVINSTVDMLATIVGYLTAARSPGWLIAILVYLSFFVFVFPRDNFWISLTLG
jgi:hypothetical protein